MIASSIPCVWMRLVSTAILHNLGLSLEDVHTLGSALSGSACADKFLHGHNRLNGLGMERWILLNVLMNGDCGMGDGWLNDFAFNYRLNGLVDVVVMVLANHSASIFSGMLCWKNLTSGLESRTLDRILALVE